MAYAREIRPERVGELAFHPLHVVDVVLDEEVVGAGGGDDVQRLTGSRQEEARYVERVDGLDQQAQSLRP